MPLLIYFDLGSAIFMTFVIKYILYNSSYHTPLINLNGICVNSFHDSVNFSNRIHIHCIYNIHNLTNFRIRNSHKFHLTRADYLTVTIPYLFNRITIVTNKPTIYVYNYEPPFIHPITEAEHPGIYFT